MQKKPGVLFQRISKSFPALKLKFKQAGMQEKDREVGRMINIIGKYHVD